MSIEKSFLVCTFELQRAFMRSAVFSNVEWPGLMPTRSLWYSDRVAEWKSKEKSEKMRNREQLKETQDERGRSIDWKSVIIRGFFWGVFFSKIRASDLFQEACCFWRCSQGEVNALEKLPWFLRFRRPVSSFHSFSRHPATLFMPLQQNQYDCAKCSTAHGECRLAVGDRHRA